MKLHYYLTICLFSFFNSFMYSQFPNEKRIIVNNTYQDELRNILNAKKEKESAHIQGSPYLVEDFRLAEISNISGKWPVRYNAYKDEIEVKKDKDIYTLKKQNPFVVIKFDNRTELVLAQFKINEEKVTGYLYKVYSNKKLSLYKYQKINFKKEKEPKSTLEIALPNRYVKSQPHYFLVNHSGNDYVEIVKNKNKLIKNLEFIDRNIVVDCYKKFTPDLNNEQLLNNFVSCVSN